MARSLFQKSAEQEPTRELRAKEALERLEEKIRTECPLLDKRVTITVSKRKELNGKTGVVTTFDHAQDRYVVMLDDEKQEGKKRAVSAKHLEPCVSLARDCAK